MSKPLRGIVERYEDTMTDRTCAVPVIDEVERIDVPFLAEAIKFKPCGAPIVEVRQWSHRDINRDEFRWECEKGHPA